MVNELTREDILRMFDSMCGCYTPTFVCDEKGCNSAFVMSNVDELISGSEYSTPLADMDYLGYKKAECEDIDEWAQEIDGNEGIESLKKTMQEGKLYIASFSDARGSMDIMFWEY